MVLPIVGRASSAVILALYVAQRNVAAIAMMLIVGLILLAGSIVSFIWLLPKNGVIHPLAQVRIDEAIPLAIVCAFVVGIALILGGLLS